MTQGNLKKWWVSLIFLTFSLTTFTSCLVRESTPKADTQKLEKEFWARAQKLEEETKEIFKEVETIELEVQKSLLEGCTQEEKRQTNSTTSQQQKNCWEKPKENLI